MKQKLFALMSVAALVASCSNDDFLTKAPNEAPKSAGIVFKLADDAATRGEFTADEAGKFATSWNAEVDRIGIIYSGVAKGLVTPTNAVTSATWNDVMTATKVASVSTVEIGHESPSTTHYAIYKTTRSGSYGWVTAASDGDVLKFADEDANPATQVKGSFRAIRPVNNTSVKYSTDAEGVPTMEVAPGDFTTQNQTGLKAEFDNFFMVADPIDDVYSATHAVGEELSLNFERPYAALAVRTVGYDNSVYGKLKSVTVKATTSNLSSSDSKVDVAKKIDGVWEITPGTTSKNVKLTLDTPNGLVWSDDAYAFIQILPVNRSTMQQAEDYTVELEFANGTIVFKKSTRNNWAANSFVNITCNLDEQDYLYLANENKLIVNKALPEIDNAGKFDTNVAANTVTKFISKVSLSAEQLKVVKNKFTGITDLTLANQSADLGDNLVNVYAGAGLIDLTLTAATVAPKLTGTGTSGALKNLNCPAVISVPAYAYQGNTILADVKFPVVETIGNYAFSGATKLKNIGCAGADDLEIGYTTATPAAKHSSLTTIGSFAFDGIAVTNVDAPEVTTMGARAFGSAAINSLTKVLLPKYDFSDTYNAIALLSGNILAEADLSAVEELGVTAIAFTGGALTTVTLKPGVKIGLSAFAGCTVLATVNNLYQAAEIGENAFLGCTALLNAKVNAAEIGRNAFKNTGLTNVVIGSGVTTISEGAFSGCVNLAVVSNLANVSSIGKEAFMGTKIPAFDFTSATLGEGAFDNCGSLKGTVRSNVSVLETNVFRNASMADRFVFPNVTTVKSGALQGVTAATLATVTFGQALTSIAGDAFSTVAAPVAGVNDGSAANKPILGAAPAAFNLILAEKTGLLTTGTTVTFKADDGKWYKITFTSVQ